MTCAQLPLSDSISLGKGYAHTIYNGSKHDYIPARRNVIEVLAAVFWHCTDAIGIMSGLDPDIKLRYNEFIHRSINKYGYCVTRSTCGSWKFSWYKLQSTATCGNVLLTAPSDNVTISSPCYACEGYILIGKSHKCTIDCGVESAV